MGDLENSLAALFFRQDWRDYHEAEGYDAFVRARSGEAVTLEARWRDEEHRSVSKTTDWGVFNGGKRMRVNDPVDEGTLRAMTGTWTFDTRNEPDDPSRGWLACTTWEWAGGELGGDFRYQRGTVDVRRYVKLSPHHEFDLRVLAGLIHDAERRIGGVPVTGFDAIPVQERFYLGGVGTMRATQFKSLAGDREALGNAELRLDVLRDLQIAVFTDVGDAWVEKDAEFDLKVDAGVGIQDADSNFRLNVAKKMDGRDGKDELFVTARIHRMF
jgi:outer membrane protein assembly factor BamA